MAISFINSYSSEWLKKKRSAATWFTIAGSFFIPLIILCAKMIYHERAEADSVMPDFWKNHSGQEWEFMAMLLLPIGVVLATSLVTQLEFRNNTWKLVHALPQKLSAIFFAKLAVIITMMVQFFVLFNIGIYFSGILPVMLFSEAHYPTDPFPFAWMLEQNALFFIDCLPIIALQYLLSLHFRNFLVPIGIGLALCIGNLIALRWEYCHWLPYNYTALHFMSHEHPHASPVSIHMLALGYFVFFTIIAYIMFVMRKERS